MAFKTLFAFAVALVLAVATASPVAKDEGSPQMMREMEPSMMYSPQMPFDAVRQKAKRKVKDKAVFYGGYPYYGGYGVYPFGFGYRGFF